jgi:hypothetical protein
VRDAPNGLFQGLITVEADYVNWITLWDDSIMDSRLQKWVHRRRKLEKQDWFELAGQAMADENTVLHDVLES